MFAGGCQYLARQNNNLVLSCGDKMVDDLVGDF